MKLYVFRSFSNCLSVDMILLDECTAYRKHYDSKSVYEQLDFAINLINKEKPDKVLIDKIGYGKGFYDGFMKMMSDGNLGFIIDMNGNVWFTNKN